MLFVTIKDDITKHLHDERLIGRPQRKAVKQE